MEERTWTNSDHSWCIFLALSQFSSASENRLAGLSRIFCPSHWTLHNLPGRCSHVHELCRLHCRCRILQPFYKMLFLTNFDAKNYLLTWYVHFPFHTGSVVYQRRVPASFDLECGLFGSQTSSWSGLISESWWVDSESPGWRCWWWVLLQQEKMLVPLSSELLLQRDLTT